MGFSVIEFWQETLLYTPFNSWDIIVGSTIYSFFLRYALKRPQFIFQIFLFPFWAWPILGP